MPVYRFILTMTSILAALAAPAGAQDATWTEHADTLVGRSGTLYGTLTRPDVDGPIPVALLIAGSGPTDRDGNQAGHGPATLVKLAHALAARGIATLRTDKRGVAQSAGAITALSDITFVGYADDAADWTDRLQADPRFSTVSLVGHSEGGLLALIAGRARGADGIVTLAGVGAPIGDALRRQLSDPQRLPDDALRAEALAIVDTLETGQVVGHVSGPLLPLFIQTVQPFLIDMMRFDPAAEATAFDGPLLIVQGTTDLQVEVADAERLAEARPDARLLVVDGMNHVLVQDGGTLLEQVAGSYADPERPLDETLVRELADFLRGVAPREIEPVR